MVKKIAVVAVMAVFGLFFSADAFAKPGKMGMMKDGKCCPMMMKGEMGCKCAMMPKMGGMDKEMPCPMEMAFKKTVKKVLAMKAELELTKEQRFAIFEIKEEVNDTITLLKADMGKYADEIKTNLSGDTADFNAAKASVNSLAAQTAKIGSTAISGMEEVMNVLTDAQKAKLAEIRAAKKAEKEGDIKDAKPAKKGAKKDVKKAKKK